MSLDLPASLNELLNSQKPRPDIAKWQPQLSGDIDIKIDQQGRWFHNGDHIKRQALVDLFATILRREMDGDFYLVTPVEKWRIQVAEHPFVIVDYAKDSNDEGGFYAFKTNVGQAYPLNDQFPLRICENSGLPIQQLPHGLSAKLNRNTFYRLVDEAEQRGEGLYITSAGSQYCLGSLTE